MRVQCRSEGWKHGGRKAALGVYSRMMQKETSSPFFPIQLSSWWKVSLEAIPAARVSCVGHISLSIKAPAGLWGKGKDVSLSGPVFRQGAFLYMSISDLVRSESSRSRESFCFLHCSRIPCIAESSGKKAWLEDKGQGFRVQSPFRKGQALLC